MSLDAWSGRNELLNQFHSAIQDRTHGRLSDLSLDVIDGALVVEARATTYYAVQLALAAIQAFVADFPKLTPAKMSFRVNGRPLVLGNPKAASNGQVVGNDDLIERNQCLLSVRQYDQQLPSTLTSHAVAISAT